MTFADLLIYSLKMEIFIFATMAGIGAVGWD